MNESQVQNPNDDKKIHIIGGGTTFTVRPHLEIAAKAFGGTARKLAIMCGARWEPESHQVILHLTKMASSGDSKINTNEDISNLLKKLVRDSSTKVIFLPAALCDFEGSILENSLPTQSGEGEMRLKSRKGDQLMLLSPATKVIKEIRKYRKDIFLIGFKTTTSASPDEQYLAGLQLLKESSCNLVLANDIHTKLNMVITPEQARYHETDDREESLLGLVDMAFYRSQLRFTRSTVVRGERIPWDSKIIPEALRVVVDHCVESGAYKPFLGSTNGHFAIKLSDGSILTSIRGKNFNEIKEIGLVRVEPKGDDEVVAHGFKPSVGGQSQRYIFNKLPEADCIVHFHSPSRSDSTVPVRSQREFECGSHECGQNTSEGLQQFGPSLWAVMLDKHGPNVVFNQNTDPQQVIKFIDSNFDLKAGTDGVNRQ